MNVTMTYDHKELFISVPWGKLALITWGDPRNEPVLMVHGRTDSAATFIPLVEELPKEFFYVGVDLPGHGKSDPFPKGLPLSRFHFVHVVEVIVLEMGWKSFIFLGHSMGCEIGLFYNAATPGVISRFVHLDVGPTFQRLQQPDHERFYRHYYHRYYSNYERYNGPNRLYTSQQAVGALMKARNMNEEQARVMLSRNLVHVRDDKYRLSWDPRAKYVVPQNMTNEVYISLFTSNAPPTLLIVMTEGHAGYTRGKEGSDQLLEGMMRNIKVVKRVVLEGGHDHHVTCPGEVGKYVGAFMCEGLSDVRSKL